MFRDRVERVAPPLAAILLLCTLGLGPGCEEESSVRTEDQLFRLSLPTNSACPSLTTVSPHFATIEITGTVFAADGQVAEGVPVIFSASPVGTFEPTTVATDARGQATVVLTTPRPPGGESNPQNLVTITGTPETGGTQIRQISVPLPPAVGYERHSAYPPG